LTSEPADSYALGRSEAETRRLIVQHQLYGPLTRQFLTAAGVTAGMKILDVGSGAGDVALLLAELVGPQGQVVGVDTNAAILDTGRSRVEAAGWTTVRFPAWLRVRGRHGAQPAAVPGADRAVRAGEVDVDTLEERLRAEVVDQDGVQLLPAIVGAWAHT
jgi:SAM-dependent methyltransferase